MTEKETPHTQENPPDIWANGQNYEAFIGRWSRPVAVEFLDWLGQPPGLEWLDVGCGTGGLSAAILNKSEPAGITGIDASAGFVGLAKEQLATEKARFAVADAQKLPFISECFDAAVSGLVLNFIPKPELALAEIKRVLKLGSTFAAYVWDYAGKMEMLRLFWEAAATLDHDSVNHAEGTRFKLCQPNALEKLFNKSGLEAVEVRGLEVSTVFQTFEDYWQPFLGGQGPAPGYVKTLDEQAKENLRQKLQQTLPTEADGSIHLVARAWAIRGARPD